MLRGIAVLLVVVVEFGLDVIEGVAEVDGTGRNTIAQGKRSEAADADSALVDIVVGADAGIGSLTVPDIKDTIGLAFAVGDTDAVLRHLGVVDVEAEVDFEVEQLGERDAFGDAEVDEDSAFTAIDATDHIVVATKDAGSVVAGKKELAGGGHLAEVEACQPPPTIVKT